MKKGRIKKVEKKESKIVENDSYSIKNLLLIIFLLVVIFGVFYFITTLIVKPTEEDKSNTVTELDYTKITLNNLLDRKEDVYFVLATKESVDNNQNFKTNYKEIYTNYINDYSEKEDALKFYNVDLDDALNKSYISDESNITENLSDLKLNDDVLFKIENGKIDKYYVGSSKIIEALSEL